MFAATHVGRDHVRVGRNNQDGAFASENVVVVTDGCGSQPQSEVGAQLGARFLGEWLCSAAFDESLPSRAVDALVKWIDVVSLSLQSGERVRERGEHLEPFFLFTFLAAVRRDDEFIVFGMGDGVVSVDSDLLTLDSGDDNAPNYCAYRLTSSSPPSVVTHFTGRASRVALMTDGLSGVAAGELWSPGLARNPFTLQRRLNVLAARERLHDDATIAILGGA
ncbi:MAG: protein phosphatase 2C domain-containing protein [Archangium sp.]